jgi:Flp pilus assembly protein TadD
MLLIRLVIQLSATLVLGASIVLAQVPPGVYDQAVDEFNHQKYQEAEETLKAALREHPQDARAVGLMGVILDAQKRYGEADNYYRRAIELSPNSASLYNNLGNHYLQEGKLESARAAYLRVAAIDPADPNANSQLAQIFITQKKGGEALRYLSRLPKEDQATSPVQLLRAQGLKLAGHSPDAEALLLDLLKRSGGDPRAAYSVGMVFAEWKSYEKAERAFSQALSSAPTDFELLYNLGLSALGAHDLDRAGQAITAALKQRPDDVDCLLALARVEDELHRDDQAAAILFRAQRLARDRPEVLTFLGNVLDQLGLYRDAAAESRAFLVLKTAVSLDSTLSEPHCLLGRLELKDDKASEAAKELELAAKLNPKSGKIHFALSRAYRRLGREDKAAEQLKVYESSAKDELKGGRGRTGIELRRW